MDMSCFTLEPLNVQNTAYIGKSLVFTNFCKLRSIDLSNIFILFVKRLARDLPNEYGLLFMFKCLVELASMSVSSIKEYDNRSTMLEDIANELDRHFKSVLDIALDKSIYDIIGDNTETIMLVIDYWREFANKKHYEPFHWEVMSFYGSILDNTDIAVTLYCLED